MKYGFLLACVFMKTFFHFGMCSNNYCWKYNKCHKAWRFIWLDFVATCMKDVWTGKHFWTGCRFLNIIAGYVNQPRKLIIKPRRSQTADVQEKVIGVVSHKSNEQCLEAISQLSTGNLQWGDFTEWCRLSSINWPVN